MKLRSALSAGVLAIGLTAAVAAPVGAQTPAQAVQPQTVRSVCAQTLYVRSQPAGVVIGTLVYLDNFDEQRTDASGTWAYGHAYGDVHKDGWVLASYLC
ncbi:MAG: hypothetical protein M3Y42_04080 [Actinomycetota bacterium]|nr:hypothetical protein [Actinomycetota bacterium]